MCLQRHDRQHRRESCGTDGHRLARGESGGQRHQPIAVDHRLLRQPSPARFATAPAREHDLVACTVARVAAIQHRAREVDARHVRIGLYQAPDAADDHAVLEIDGRVFDRDGDIAGRQTRLFDRDHGGRYGAIRILQQQCLEHA